MANASAKRIASQNERAIRNLRIGMVVINIISIFLRLFRHGNLNSVSSIILYLLPILPTLLLYKFLVNAGTPKKDASGTLLSPGDDLSQHGLLDWSWDIIYVTWACQIASGLLGSWIWYLYLTIPLYAGYKIWNSFISPILLGNSTSKQDTGEPSNEPTSKRQEKLRKRQEKGDPRVRAMPIRG